MEGATHPSISPPRCDDQGQLVILVILVIFVILPMLKMVAIMVSCTFPKPICAPFQNVDPVEAGRLHRFYDYKLDLEGIVRN